LDSDLFLPEDWADDPVRRAAAFIPDNVGYRKKADIALAQIQRALSNGIRVAAWTFDSFYGRDGQFLEGLEALGQNYVAEVPSTFTGWLQEPLVLLRPTPQEMRKAGRKRCFPRLARKALPACEVRSLLTCSRVFQKQKWRPFRIKDGEKGPLVWEVKHAVFYRKRSDGLPGGAQSLIVARNVLDRSEIKFFVSNLVPGSQGVSLEWLLWVAFSRWPIERCFQQAKDELGMDHFEVRGWRGIHRHLYLTQLSHLFCARERFMRREKKRRREPDRRTGSQCGLGLHPIPEPAALGSDPTPPGHGRTLGLLPAA
jgi:SRSO17 transposase